jgi:hypothetical protein
MCNKNILIIVEKVIKNSILNLGYGSMFKKPTECTSLSL